MLLILDVVYKTLGMALSLERSADTVLLGDDAGRECGIGDQHYERGGWICFHYFADDAIWRDHGHATFDSTGRPAVDKHYFGIGFVPFPMTRAATVLDGERV